MAHDVFISHSSKDKQTADAVCAILESKAIRCWVAPRDIQPGADWGEAILEGIRGSKVVVLVFSRNANESVQIKREIERAVHHGIPIIPLRIEDILPSGTLEFSISTAHWLDAFTPPMERHLTYLADTVRAILDKKPPPPPVPPGPVPPPPWRNIAIAGGVVVAALLFYIIVRLMFPPSVKGDWNLTSSQLNTGQNSAIADLITTAITGPHIQGQLQVKSLNEYSLGVTATDTGKVTTATNQNVSGAGSVTALTFTSDTSHNPVTITWQFLEDNGQWGAFGVPTGAKILLFGVNAGAAEVILHGNPSPQLGGSGQVDNAVVGTWAGTPFNMNPPNNLWNGTLEIHADGSYVLTVKHDESGLLDVTNGNWSAKPSGSSGIGMPNFGIGNGLLLSGHYSFSGSNLLNVATESGNFTFKRGW